jgi:hypothetical protein
MYILVTAFLIVGAFGVAGAATALPITPWLAHVGTVPRPEALTVRPPAQVPPAIR